MTTAVQLRTKIGAELAESTFLGKMLTEDSYTLLVTGDTDVFKPDGKRLGSLIKNAIPQGVYDHASEALLHLKGYLSSNRATYAGGYRAKRLREDGTQSSTNVAVDSDGNELKVASSIIGFFERSPRMPFCRQTAFTAHELERWRTVVPLAQCVAGAYLDRTPEHFRRHNEVAGRTEPSFVIPGTPFTTMTVNNTVRGACHRDAGDLKEGMGCISAMRLGSFDGFFLVFPEYQVAFDIGPNDLLLFDPHEMHGNTPIKHASEDAQRVSIVFYYRAGMEKCLSPAEEQERAKKRGKLELE